MTVEEKQEFALSPKSLAKLEEVHPLLRDTVVRAIAVTDTDFTVHEGLRGVTKQKQLVAAGASRTMNSRHITGHAVDLVPWLGGPRWDWPLCYRVAKAMQLAAIHTGAVIVWGGVWDRTLNGLEKDMAEEVGDYVVRRRAVGEKSVFIDGPHFELAREIYP